MSNEIFTVEFHPETEHFSLRSFVASNQAHFDPFCGRGTTNFSARLVGLGTVGIDCSPIAIAMTEAKLAPVGSPSDVVAEARRILSKKLDCDVPRGRFWKSAYRSSVLADICRIRSALLSNCRSPARKALRAIMLGALHGPLQKDGTSSYFSNQAPRTYAPKPNYAVSFWRRTGFHAPDVEVLGIIGARALRYYAVKLPTIPFIVRRGDSRNFGFVKNACADHRPRLIVTSPPYYGLKTYIPDQWLRNWFLGGPEEVDYRYGIQLSHRSVSAFVDDLCTVWKNVAAVCHKDARLIFRFGAINDRCVDPREIMKASLRNAPWELVTIVNAGTARGGKRQADSFNYEPTKPIAEYDAWAARV
jgi:hypothetical protein